MRDRAVFDRDPPVGTALCFRPPSPSLSPPSPRHGSVARSLDSLPRPALATEPQQPSSSTRLVGLVPQRSPTRCPMRSMLDRIEWIVPHAVLLLLLPLPSSAATGNMFGDQRTMKEKIRDQKRMVERSVRGLERDRANLEKDEKKLILEIKVRSERRLDETRERRGERGLNASRFAASICFALLCRNKPKPIK